MKPIIASFKEFFKETLKKDVSNHLVNKNDFTFFLEMAKETNIETQMRYLIDEDDIKFLQQFPAQYWAQAMCQRFDMLWDAIVELNDKRKPHSKAIAKELANYIKNRDFSQLNRFLNADESAELYKQIDRMSEKDIEAYAKHYSMEHAKQKVEDLSIFDSGSEQFAFKKTGRTKGYVFFAARPHLNTLYHKLETNIDQNYSAKSGLPTHHKGRYGWSMLHPEVIGNKKVTQGLVWPDHAAISIAVNDFLRYNAHHYFGELYDKNNWKEISGIEDTETYQKLYNKLYKEVRKEFDRKSIRFNNQNEKELAIKKETIKRLHKEIEQKNLPAQELEDSIKDLRVKDNASKEKKKQSRFEINRVLDDLIQKYKPMPEYQEQLSDEKLKQYEDYFLRHLKNKHPEMTMNELMEEALLEAKKEAIRSLAGIKGPKIPGITEHGFSLVRTGTNNKDFESSKIYLPHKKSVITYIDEDGKERKEVIDVPDVRPQSLVRPREEEDRGQEFVGHEKDHVLVPHEDIIASGKSVTGTTLFGGINPNKHTRKRENLLKGQPGYDEGMAQIFGGEKFYAASMDSNFNIHILSTKNGVFPIEIIYGIQDCLLSPSCGGNATLADRVYVANSIESFCSIIYLEMLSNVGRSELYTSNGRKLFARKFIYDLLQTDVGSGTRRLRKFTDLPTMPSSPKTEKRGRKKYERGDIESDPHSPYSVIKLLNMTQALGAEAKALKSEKESVDKQILGLKRLLQSTNPSENIVDISDILSRYDASAIKDATKAYLSGYSNFVNYLQELLIQSYQQSAMNTGASQEKAKKDADKSFEKYQMLANNDPYTLFAMVIHDETVKEIQTNHSTKGSSARGQEETESRSLTPASQKLPQKPANLIPLISKENLSAPFQTLLSENKYYELAMYKNLIENFDQKYLQLKKQLKAVIETHKIKSPGGEHLSFVELQSCLYWLQWSIAQTES